MLPGNEQGDHGADDAERNDGEDDECALEGLELEQQDAEEAEDGDHDDGAESAETFRAVLHFAGGPGEFLRQVECLHAVEYAPVTGGVVAFLRVTGDGDVAVLL